MPDAGGPLWNVGSGWGYSPYAAVTQGNARRLAGLGADSADFSGAATTTAQEILRYLRTEPPELRGRILRAAADRMKTGGGAALEAIAAAAVARGVPAPAALEGALVAFLEDVYRQAQDSGRRPAWTAPAGFGGVEDWNIYGKIIDKAATTLTNLASTGACIAGVDKLCPYKGPSTVSTTNVYGKQDDSKGGTPGWVLPVAIVGGVLLLGLVGVVTLRR